MRFSLDTNALIALTKHHPAVRRRIEQHRVSDVGVSAIVMHELYFGAYGGTQTARNLAEYRKFPFEIIDLSRADAEAAGRIRAHLRARGTPIGAYDVLIAGQALARGLTLVTNNTGEFSRVPELMVEDWQAE